MTYTFEDFKKLPSGTLFWFLYHENDESGNEKWETHGPLIKGESENFGFVYVNLAPTVYDKPDEFRIFVGDHYYVHYSDFTKFYVPNKKELDYFNNQVQTIIS